MFDTLSNVFVLYNFRVPLEYRWGYYDCFTPVSLELRCTYPFDMLNCFTHLQEFKYMALELMDSPRFRISDYFPICTKFIDDALGVGGKVYVHCHQGVSRSCSIVIAYLMLKRSMSFIDAQDFVKSQRSVCRPNVGFTAQLIEWGKMGAQPLTVPTSSMLYMMTHIDADDHESAVVGRACFGPDGKPLPISPSSFDPRGVFLFLVPRHTIIWIGESYKGEFQMMLWFQIWNV